MKIIESKNIQYIGFNHKVSLLDEIYPEKGVKMPIILFAHGFKGYKDWGHFPLVAKNFAKQGFYVIKFNFSHNGGTVNNPIDFDDLEAFSSNSYWKELVDIEKILEWISKNDLIVERGGNLSNINILGHSRGGGVSLIAASKFPILKKVISWAAISDFKGRLPDHKELLEWELNGVRYIQNSRTNQQMPMKFEFVKELRDHEAVLNIEKATKSLQTPQLIIHGSADSSVDVNSAYDLKKWNSDAQLEIIENAQHTFGGSHPWTNDRLPDETIKAIQLSSEFILSA